MEKSESIGLPRTGWTLDKVESPEVQDPVVQVIDQSNGEVLYTVRINGASFTPKVFKAGTYTVKVTDPDTSYEKSSEDQKARRES